MKRMTTDPDYDLGMKLFAVAGTAKRSLEAVYQDRLRQKPRYWLHLEISDLYEQETGKSPPGSFRTSRLRKKRADALDRWLTKLAVEKEVSTSRVYVMGPPEF